MIRCALLPVLLVSAALAVATAGPVFAQTTSPATDAAKKKTTGKDQAAKDKKDKADENKPLLVVTFGDWGVYHSEAAKGRICYTLAQPKDREPADLKRDPAYAFISDRPGEGVRNEVSFIMGFDVANPPDESADPKDKKKLAKPVKAATVTIGDQSFELVAKASNLWVKNAAKEGQLVDEMRKGAKLEVKATSMKGNLTTDTYSLAGFSQALERVLKDCPAGK